MSVTKLPSRTNWTISPHHMPLAWKLWWAGLWKLAYKVKFWLCHCVFWKTNYGLWTEICQSNRNFIVIAFCWGESVLWHMKDKGQIVYVPMYRHIPRWIQVKFQMLTTMMYKGEQLPHASAILTLGKETLVAIVQVTGCAHRPDQSSVENRKPCSCC